MPQTITVSSSAAGKPAGNFSINCNPFIDVSDGAYEVALVAGILWNSSPNLSTANNNNILIYNNGVSDQMIVFTDGVWSVSGMSSWIANAITNNGDDPTNLVLAGYPDPNRTEFQLSGGYTVTISAGLGNILGFDAGTYDVTTIGQHPANISNNFSAFIINFPGIVDPRSSYTNGSQSSELYTGSWTYPANARNPLPISYPQYVAVNPQEKYIRRVEVLVTNQDGIILDFNQGGNFANNSSQFTLSFRRIGSFDL